MYLIQKKRKNIWPKKVLVCSMGRLQTPLNTLKLVSAKCFFYYFFFIKDYIFFAVLKKWGRGLIFFVVKKNWGGRGAQ